MKQFFKFMFASMLGFGLSVVLLFIFFIAIIAGIAGSLESKKEVKVDGNTVLRISLDYNIEERTPKDPFQNFQFGEGSKDKHLGLDDILKSIRFAQTDDHIKGILLDLMFIPAGQAAIEDIRNELLRFKKSGKFIVAYGEIYTESAYYIASVADKIYLNPSGDMLFNGFSTQLLYMKGMLDKAGLHAQVIKHGRFKSAAETFVEDKMSDANREQITVFVGSMYKHYMSRIAESRKKTEAEVMDIADNLKIQNPEDAKKLGMVDGLLHKDEVMNELKKRLKLKESDDVKMVNLGIYRDAVTGGNSAKEKIAVIYAVGDITSGEGDEESIGSDHFTEAIKKAREDKNVKAIVLRVNSPGGSALASDVIFRELMLAKGKKPIIVSMGNVAASGGYFISMAADTIVAQPNTITGSIGVIGLFMSAQDLLNNKLGLHVDGVKFGKYADLGRADRPLNEDEKAIIQRSVDRIYDDFVNKVAKARHKTYADIDSIAQGRVWTGIDAKAIGLVDVLGGIDAAIEIAARKAGLKDYRIQAYPEQKNPLELVFNSFSAKMSEKLLQQELGEQYTVYRQAKKASQMRGIQARLPYEIVIE